MLVVNKSYLSMIDCGPAIGMRGLFIDIKEIAQPTKEQSKKSLYEMLQDKLDEEFELKDKMFKKRQFYETAIDGTKRTYLVFLGGDIDKKSNYKDFSKLSEDISKESIKIQKDFKINQLSPPFMVFIGKPSYLTGSTVDSGFYQHFNCITGVIKQNKLELEDYNKLSAQEVLNHTFGSLVIKCEHNLNEHWNKIIDPVIKQYTITNKLYIADGCDSSSLREFCLLAGLRYQNYLDNEWTFSTASRR